MKVKEIKVSNYLTKSNLPGIDFVINPYIGCSHACKYCYASFMKKFSNHKENWGEFVDIKLTTKSSLILRDIDILKEFKNLRVCISINTIDEKFKSDMDKASSIKERLNTLLYMITIFIL